jgi:hypothetical protein
MRAMDLVVRERLRLDYADANGPNKLLGNLSGVAVDGERLWTVSDEGRSLEVLAPDGTGGYRLAHQYALDTLIPGIPDADGDKPGELDLESITIRKGQLWLSGSHCLVRQKPPETAEDRLESAIRSRPSRFLLARFDLGPGGLTNPVHLPFEGEDSLRGRLLTDSHLAPFLALPSKENGLDIEGMCRHQGQTLLGCRGPLLDDVAAVVALEFARDRFAIAAHTLHFLDLGGLAIRDLTRWGEDGLVLAGPVGDVHGPFRLYRWTPEASDRVQQPVELRSFPLTGEKPEGICALRRKDRDGWIVLYDSPSASRIKEDRYTADWIGF